MHPKILKGLQMYFANKPIGRFLKMKTQKVVDIEPGINGN